MSGPKQIKRKKKLRVNPPNPRKSVSHSENASHSEKGVPLTKGKEVQRTVIIGLDGVPHTLIAALAENGVMPNIADIIQRGIFRQMDSSIPEISSVAWSSIIT